jgi:hypothetical protein
MATTASSRRRSRAGHERAPGGRGALHTETAISFGLAAVGRCKPRVLGTSAVAPVRHEEVEARGSSEQQMMPEIAQGCPGKFSVQG